MSYIAAAMYCQPLVTQSGGGGGDCELYIRPSPTNVITNLDKPVVLQPPTAVSTDLCAEVI
ncbi:hypothetical protein [Luteimonas fraxinea]|uniref:Uncharacterized protein n=1 Tax=Luteimonas fraxinea TaxID=2901869 RepID=A0ABS8UE60_9GAMM|nr:hypothetical protein [Luteimonas fraxinea]MCD9097031.1 hypothetical protein [Luteimonas fraxinea]